MIRKNAVSVKVKAPSRGLVARWPSETADRFQPDATGMPQRAAVVAQNVRFEDGVAAAAPGYQAVTVSFTSGGPLVGPSLIHEGDLITSTNTPSDKVRPLVVGDKLNLYYVTPTYASGVFSMSLAPVYSNGGSPTSGYLWKAADFYDKVIFAQANVQPQFWYGGAASAQVLPGLAWNSQSMFSSADDGYSKWEGVLSFFGHLVFWRQNLIIWSDVNDYTNFVPVGLTATNGVYQTNADFAQPAVGGTSGTITFASNSNAPLTVSQFVRIVVAATGTVNYYQVVTATDNTHTTLKLLGTTGAATAGTTIPNGSTLTTLNANEAGTAMIVGNKVNGPIYQMTQLGDYAYILKQYSIQSMQYVGQSGGTFTVHTEVVDEGLLGRNAMVNLGNATLVFLGHRELYSYAGGNNPQPVCRQYTRQLYNELDRSRLDSVRLFHRHMRNEVWVVYPVQGGGWKVLIWNYVEDSATLDFYNEALAGLTVANRVNLPTAAPWSSGTIAWNAVDPAKTWTNFQSGANEFMVMGTGNGSLLVHGTTYDAAGQPYVARVEFMDFDFGDNAAFKYVDVVHLGLQVLADDTVTRNLYVQIGARPTLDADITWTTPKAIQVQGNANFTAKVNPGGAGRYIRLAVYSQDAGVQWRVSSFEIYARAGGTY